MTRNDTQTPEMTIEVISWPCGNARPGEGELVDAEGDEVGRQAGVDDRVADRPATDQAGRLAEEEGRGLRRRLFHAAMLASQLEEYPKIGS